jgi:hypothetical protein
MSFMLPEGAHTMITIILSSAIRWSPPCRSSRRRHHRSQEGFVTRELDECLAELRQLLEKGTVRVAHDPGEKNHDSTRELGAD